MLIHNNSFILQLYYILTENEGYNTFENYKSYKEADVMYSIIL